MIYIDPRDAVGNQPSHWFSIGNSVVSLLGALLSGIGLYFGIRAWLAADRADKSAQRAEAKAGEAAREARAALRKGDAAEDVRVMGEMAIALISFVEDAKAEGAKLKARDLAIKTAHVINRRSRFFSEEAKGRFEKLNTDVLAIARTLAVGVPADENAREDLLNTCYDVMAGITGESGRILADIEKDEE